MMNKDHNRCPSLLDREIDSEQADAFGHRDFAVALESLIESPTHEPPYSIGLLGSWGSGKSSIKSIYLAQLNDHASTDAQRPKRSTTVFPITFNAWRFGGDDIKRALLRHVYLTVGGNPISLTDALFRKIEETVQTPRPWRAIIQDVFDRWLWSLVQLLIVLLAVTGVLASVAWLFDIDNGWAVAAIVVALAWLGREFAKYLFSAQRLLIPRYSSLVRVDEPRTSAEEYEDLFIQQLHEFKKGKGKKYERIVVFVDDLDRLSAEEMVSGLDAVRTFLEIPKKQLPDGIGIVFVISCDEDRVAQALSGRSRPSRRSPDLPATVSDKASARLYLDRIFQFRLDIPDLPKLDMRNFALSKLKSELPELEAELREKNVPVENLIDRLIHVEVRNPRNAIQLLNAFSHAWWLAKRREKEGAGTQRPGGLQEGVVTEHPIALAAICVLRVNFPDFYRDLQRDAELIERFIDVFHRQQPFDQLPESTQGTLSPYRTDDGELQSEHRSLRQYLVSLQGIRWPRSLQPLLLLAQDPVTRRLGDNALPLYEAFVSGNHLELLQLLNRDKDGQPLSADDVRLLRAMTEDLHRERDVRRNNAAACLAAVADRLPINQAHHLISPLARRLADSDELRWRLGIGKIRSVLPLATREDRQDVAGKLISDLLLVEGDITFRLESMQTPSLEEATEMAREACELVLWVRSNDGLRPSDDDALLKWLESRRVSIGDKEYVFPFASVEEWLEEHDGHLLPALGPRYTEMVLVELGGQP